MKARVLFVDDEPRVLEGLQRVMRTLRADWDVSVAPDGASALAIIDAHPFDLVVSDMRMPGMGGAELLTQVRDRRPGTVRFVLSGQTEPEAAMRTVSLAHQFLSKPCHSDLLFRALGQVRVALSALPDAGERDLVVGTGALGCSAATARALREALDADQPSVDEVARVAAQDVAVAATMLHLVNSSFFCPQRDVSDVRDAVKILGVSLLGELARKTDAFKARDVSGAETMPAGAGFPTRVGELVLSHAMQHPPGYARNDVCSRLGHALLGLWRVPVSRN